MFRCGVFEVGELLQSPRASHASKLFTLKCALNCWQRCNSSLLLALGIPPAIRAGTVQAHHPYQTKTPQRSVPA